MKRKKRRPAPKKKKPGGIKKFFLTVLIVLIILAGSLFGVAWFYGGSLLKDQVIRLIRADSRGLYKAEIRTLYFDLLSGKIRVTGFKLIPDTANFRKENPNDTMPPFIVSASVNKFVVNGFDVLKAVRDKNVEITLIRIESPVVHLIACHSAEKKKKPGPKRDPLSIPLPATLNSIRIDRFQIVNGRLTITDRTKKPVTEILVPSFWADVNNIQIDSIRRKKARILNSDDIALGIRGIRIRTKNGMYTITMGEIGLSTGLSKITVTQLRIRPEFSEFDFSRRLGYQADRVDLTIKKITLSGTNIREMLLHRKIIADQASVENMKLCDYRDKRVPLKIGYSPPMPQEMLRKFSPYLRIDTVRLKNGHATYSEQVNDEPGKLFFDRMDISMTNLTNDLVLANKRKEMQITGTARFMGKGLVRAHFTIPLQGKGTYFRFTGSLSEMDMCEFNPMLSKLMSARIRKGEIHEINVRELVAGDETSTGMLEFRYSGLKVGMLKKKQTSWENFKTKILNFAANDLVIPDENPDKKGNLTTGIIYFHRDPSKGFFNYVWKSIQSGIISTIGINSKEQKKMKKEMKRKN